MKLTDAQFGALHTLNQFGPSAAVEVLQAPNMAGVRKVKLQWHVANAATLSKLEAAGLVAVARKPVTRAHDAVGRLGLPKREIQISITEAGRAAIAA
jgi:DNA-binding MarR family transcriptional regulator